MTRWGQFVAMAMGQLSGRCSLRDIVANMDAQTHKHYHLGVGRVSRSSLARVNGEQPYTLYEQMFGRLLSRCQGSAPGHGFRFKNKRPCCWLDVSLGEVQADERSPRCLNRPAGENEWGVLKLSAVTSGQLKPSENKTLPPGAESRPEVVFLQAEFEGKEVKRGDVLITRGERSDPTRGSDDLRRRWTTEQVGAESRPALEVKRGDVLITRRNPTRGSDDLRRMSRQDDDLRSHLSGDLQSKIDPAFLAATLATTNLRSQIESQRTGAAPMMQKITKSALMSLRLPLPPETEQVSLRTTLADARTHATALRQRAQNERAEAWADLETAVYATEEDDKTIQ